MTKTRDAPAVRVQHRTMKPTILGISLLVGQSLMFLYQETSYAANRGNHGRLAYNLGLLCTLKNR